MRSYLVGFGWNPIGFGRGIPWEGIATYLRFFTELVLTKTARNMLATEYLCVLF